MSRVNAGLGLCVTVLLTGCALGSGSPAPTPTVRGALECEVELTPEVLPSADLLVDTAGLNQDLRDLREIADPDSFLGRQITITLGYEADGVNTRRDILTHDLEPFVADSVQKLVFARRRELPDSEHEWGVRLVIGLGQQLSYSVARREYCPPRPRNQEIESAIRTYIGSGVRYRGGSRVRTVVVRVTVHPAGYIVTGEIVRGGAAGSSLERQLVDYLRQFTFEPATIDGAPTYGQLDLPVQVAG